MLPKYGSAVIDNARREAEQARKELPASAQKKLDRAIQLAIQEIRLRMEAEFAEKLKSAVEEERMRYRSLIEETEQQRDLAKAEYEKALQIRLGIDSHMTQDEYKSILGLLHPDRHPPEFQERANRAFDVFRRLEKTVNDKLPIAVLRTRGWEQKSPYYHKFHAST
jgi:hypothetical protein